MEFGAVDISEIRFDPKSRDDIPQLLRGLQYIYTNASLRKEIFTRMEAGIAPTVNKRNGRPGLELWKVFVMGILRLDLNMDYDRLQELVNHHDTIRKMLGHGDAFDKYAYQMQTLKDNVSLLTPELLEEINQIVVAAGHELVKKKGNEALRGRCDSFVVETDVHYPTDIGLLQDALRKIIILTARLSKKRGKAGWRQSDYHLKQAKRLMRKAQNTKRSQSRDESARAKKIDAVKAAHSDYLKVSRQIVEKAAETLKQLENSGKLDVSGLLEVDVICGFIIHAERQMDQINRRVLQGEVIPHEEKVFSIFQPHTEYICKGKAGVPVELGMRVCILEDQYQFILTHLVMEKKTDDQVAVEITKAAKARFPDLKQCSYDKGFHSPRNQVLLSEVLEFSVLARKGKLSRQNYAIENTADFKAARQQHSAVESAINALEVHGCDRCPDDGIDGFKRYVALAVVARNIHRIGTILKKQEEAVSLRKKLRLFRREEKTQRLAA
jgi:hypothetical protein